MEEVFVFDSESENRDTAVEVRLGVGLRGRDSCTMNQSQNVMTWHTPLRIYHFIAVRTIPYAYLHCSARVRVRVGVKVKVSVIGHDAR